MTIHTRFPAGALTSTPPPSYGTTRRGFFLKVKFTLLVWVREAVNLATLRHLGYEESDYNKGSLYDRRPIEISKI